MIVFPLDIGELAFADLMKRPFPQVVNIREHVRFAAQGQRVLVPLAAGFLPVFAGIVECVAQATIHLVATVDRGLDCDFLGRSLHRKSAGTGVKVARVFTNDCEIDVFRPFILQRGFHAGIQFDRAQIDVLIQREAGFEQNSLLQDTRGHIGMPDSAQQNRIKLAQLFNRAVGERFSGTFVSFAPEIEFGQLDFEIKFSRCSLENLNSFSRHLGPGPVTGHYSYFIHRVPPMEISFRHCFRLRYFRHRTGIIGRHMHH